MNNKEVLKDFSILLMLLLIMALSYTLIENKQNGFDQGRYIGWIEACESMNKNHYFKFDMLQTDYKGNYFCANSNDTEYKKNSIGGYDGIET